MYKLIGSNGIPPKDSQSSSGNDRVHDGELLGAYSRAVIDVGPVRRLDRLNRAGD